MRTKIFSSVSYRILAALALTALVLAAVPASSAQAATINVNTFADQFDGNPGNGECSLREAVANANNNSKSQNDCAMGTGDDTIVLPAGLYVLSNAGGGGDLDISDTSSLTIQSNGGQAIIDGSGQADHIFDVTSLAGNFTINGITVKNGNTTGSGAGVNYGSSSGTLTVLNSTISDNTATGTANCGAGIYSNAANTVVITNSTIQNNTCSDASSDGGGVFKNTGTLTISGSTFYNNSAGDNGGAIQVADGTATITNSTFSTNTAGNRGGGIQVGAGTVTINFSTFSHNAGNGAVSGVNAGGALQASGGTVAVNYSIFANSTAGTDCDKSNTATVVFTDSVVEANNDCTGTFIASDPGLGALGNNGGPTQTMAITNSSPAFDAADSCASLTADQRGTARPQGSACDIGAFELLVADTTPPTVVSVNRLDANPNGNATVRYTVTFSEPVTGAGGTTTDFSLTTTGLTGASVASVSGSGATYTVTVNTGSGNGTLRLNVVDDDSIIDAAGNPLGGPGVGNGTYTSGQVYDIQRTLPGASTPAAPSGNIGSSYNPTYNWSAVNSATWYQLYVSGPNGFVINEWFEASAVCSGSNCLTTASKQLGGGSHTWWVRTWNSAGFGPWSSAQNFTTNPPPVPGAATPTGPNAPISSNMPTYTWNSGSNATWYQLWVNGPSGTAVNAWYAASTNCSGSNCSATPNVALGAGSYTFWVRTWGPGGYGPWSSAMNFSFNLPGAATLTSPSGNTPSSNPTYTWNRVPGASWYYLWVNGPSGTVFATWYEAAVICNSTTCSTTGSAPVSSSGAHTFWVRTWNQLGYGPWSAGQNFTRP